MSVTSQTQHLISKLVPSSTNVLSIQELATLWAGYGHVYRVTLRSESGEEVNRVLKVVSPPAPSATTIDSPDEGHLRKLLSYQVETYFYSHLSRSLVDAPAAYSAHVPRCFGAISEGSTQALLLEDLSDGFPVLAETRRSTLDETQTNAALRWLARFHAHWWDCDEGTGSSGVPPPLEAHKLGWDSESKQGVWQQGGYSYLDTRLQELDAIPSTSQWARFKGPLAWAVDFQLKQLPYQTLVHGDVKTANMAFTESGTECALYDFQYIGRGLGVQDLAKFLTTSVPARALANGGEDACLRVYHTELCTALSQGGGHAGAPGRSESEHGYTFDVLKEHWELALITWVRFQAGWGFWGNEKWVQERVLGTLSRPGYAENLERKWSIAQQRS